MVDVETKIKNRTIRRCRITKIAASAQFWKLSRWVHRFLWKYLVLWQDVRSSMTPLFVWVKIWRVDITVQRLCTPYNNNAVRPGSIILGNLSNRINLTPGVLLTRNSNLLQKDDHRRTRLHPRPRPRPHRPSPFSLVAQFQVSLTLLRRSKIR